MTGLSLALGELRTYVQTTGEETDETIQRLQSLIEQTATRLKSPLHKPASGLTTWETTWRTRWQRFPLHPGIQ